MSKRLFINWEALSELLGQKVRSYKDLQKIKIVRDPK